MLCGFRRNNGMSIARFYKLLECVVATNYFVATNFRSIKLVFVFLDKKIRQLPKSQK